MSNTEYPEHDKLHKIKDDSQTIGEFLEWLGEHGVTLCRWQDQEGDFWNEESDEFAEEGFYPDHISTVARLAAYFEIDLDVIETEKRAMLDKLREANAR